MKFFSASKAAAIIVIASPLLALAFPVPNLVNWLAERNLEQPPATAAEVEQFPKYVPRSYGYEPPQNHTNGTNGDAPENGYGHYRRGLTPLPREVDAPAPPSPKIQDLKAPQPDVKVPPGVEKREHTQSYCPDCRL